jgi:hypothetical protein
MTVAQTPAATPLFSVRTMIWVVLVGVFAFAAMVVLAAYAPDLRTGSDAGAHVLSKSAVGFGGIRELLQELHEPLVISGGPPPRVKAGQGLLIMTPGPAASARDIEALHFGGVRLVVLPKWIAGPDPVNPEWAMRIGVLPEDLAAAPLGGGHGKTTLQRRAGVSRPVLKAGEGFGFPAGEAIPLGRIDQLQTLSGPGWDPVLTDEQGHAVLAVAKQGGIAVLSDPDLLNTQGVADLTTARAAVEIIDRLRSSGPVDFDVTLNGFGRGRSLLKLAFSPPLLGATLCLFAAALMMGLHAVIRFGPPERPPPVLALGKRALADNSAALVRMAKREPRMAPAYAALTREAAARAVGAPRDLGAAQLDALLDRLGRTNGASFAFSALAAEAEGARTNTDLMEVARRLHRWRGEMTRDRR